MEKICIFLVKFTYNLYMCYLYDFFQCKIKNVPYVFVKICVLKFILISLVSKSKIIVIVFKFYWTLLTFHHETMYMLNENCTYMFKDIWQGYATLGSLVLPVYDVQFLFMPLFVIKYLCTTAKCLLQNGKSHIFVNSLILLWTVVQG